MKALVDLLTTRIDPCLKDPEALCPPTPDWLTDEIAENIARACGMMDELGDESPSDDRDGCT